MQAGTPAIAEAIGFGAAADYLQDIGMARIQALEAELGGYLHQEVCRLAELMCCDGHNLQGLWGWVSG